jgi:hypothetical protein
LIEDHLILELGIGEEPLQNPANPEILLDDDRPIPNLLADSLNRSRRSEAAPMAILSM